VATIQINAASVNKKTGHFVEGNGRRKFLVSIVKYDPETIQPSYEQNVRRSVSVWLPLKAENDKGHEITLAENVTRALENLKKQGKGERLHLNAVIRNLTMGEPAVGENDIVYQDLTVTIDNSGPKSITKVAPAPWSIVESDL